ncbi:MAG: hypothetical protein Ct9H300mP27_09090 [Chloroflexota bacterium]|nr:MAG: hypothetical protein Ct9H300mP27_09090 [Chloroflexota bacterium]
MRKPNPSFSGVSLHCGPTELWDGNIQDHADQGVAITVVGEIGGKETPFPRFNCFDIEKVMSMGLKERIKRTEWILQ